MEYKKCEHCGEQIHIRSKKCPFCNEVVAEVPSEELKVKEEVVDDTNNINETVLPENSDDIKHDEEETPINEPLEQNNVEGKVNYCVGSNEPKDYVYKAEVRHSIEYVEPMSNWTKVFISALCVFPLIGQLVGSFLGVLFVTYEDNDRRSFGKALIALAIIMFFIYCAYLSQMMKLMEGIDIEALYKSIGM